MCAFAYVFAHFRDRERERERDRDRDGENDTYRMWQQLRYFSAPEESLVSFQFAIWLVAAAGKLMSAQQINSTTLQRCFARVATLQVTFKVNTHTHSPEYLKTLISFGAYAFQQW